MSELIGKLSGVFERNFVMAYWAPLFVSVGYAALAVVLQRGFRTVLEAWTKLTVSDQIVLAAAALVVLTVLAYVLEAFTGLVIRAYEGYTWISRALVWPPWRRRASSAAKPHFTRLGRAIHSGEDRPRRAFQLDSIFWWPRLYLVLPDGFKQQMSGFFTPMVGLLNLCNGMTLAAAAGGLYLALSGAAWLLAVAIFAAGILFAWGCYAGAVRHAEYYAGYFGIAYDLYRHDLLKQLGVFVPADYVDEIRLWRVLEAWMRDRERPDSDSVELEAAYLPAPAWMQGNFYYSGKPPAPEPPPAPAAGRVTIDYELHPPSDNDNM